MIGHLRPAAILESYNGSFGIDEYCTHSYPVADQGFPFGGVRPLGGHGPPTQTVFGENVCENERIGSHRGGGVHRARPLDPPMLALLITMGARSQSIYVLGSTRIMISDRDCTTFLREWSEIWRHILILQYTTCRTCDNTLYQMYIGKLKDIKILKV